MQLPKKHLPRVKVEALSDAAPQAELPEKPALAFAEIPLNQVKDKLQICYISAIALKLAGQKNAMDEARKIVNCLNQVPKLASTAAELHAFNTIHFNAAEPDFTAQAVTPGWIYLQLTDQVVARWLQAFASQPMHLSRLGLMRAHASLTLSLRNSTREFHILYTHARCCSLLRSAAQDHLIQLAYKPLELGALELSIIEPEPLPWLTSGSCLRCQDAAERRLIFQAVALVDHLADDRANQQITQPDSPTSDQSWKLTEALCQAFEAFYAACRIWGSVSVSQPELAQARLGLVLLTQKLLQMQLRSLGINPPLEL